MTKAIFWDMDEVLAQLGAKFVERATASHGSCPPMEAWTDYRSWHLFLGLTGGNAEEEGPLKEYFHDQRLLEDCQPFSDALRALYTACERGYDNHIITARAWHREAYDVTVDWLVRHHLWQFISSVTITGHGQSKTDELVKHRHHDEVALFVEDSLTAAWEAGAAGFKVALLDRPWNRGTLVGLGANRVHRVNTTSDAVGLVA